MSKEKEKSTQWHPLFAALLRPLLQNCYEVKIDVPVGDLPRKADIVLLRRTGDPPTPFRGLLRHLTTWNILEFKGRSVSARIRHLDLLVEVGLGIDRRLNEERVHQKQRPLSPDEISFWYIANRFGKRYLHEARRRLGTMEEVERGVWRSQILSRPLFLIDGRSVPVEPESVPIHLVGEEQRTTSGALARVIVNEPGFWEQFAPLLRTLHPSIWEEARNMARSKGKGAVLDLSPLIDEVGLEKYLEIVNVKDYIETVGPKKVLKEMGIERILANLSAEDRKKLKEQLK